MATILLIHGAYQGGWIWQRVAQALRAGGHRVLAPSLDGCGERRHAIRPGITTETHAAELAELMFFEDLRDVVMVGTSTGGMVMCRTAELVRERVGRLVFADALALMNREALPDIVTRRNLVNTEVSTVPAPDDAKTRLFAGLDDATQAWALERYTPQPIATMEAPVHLDRFWDQTWRTTVIWCRQSPNPPQAHQRRTAAHLHGHWLELDTGHYPMLTKAEELAAMIMQG